MSAEVQGGLALQHRKDMRGAGLVVSRDLWSYDTHVTVHVCTLYTTMLWAGESEELQFSSEVMAAINETAYNYAGAVWGILGGAWWVGPGGWGWSMQVCCVLLFLTLETLAGDLEAFAM